MREAKDDPATFLRGEIELVDDDQHGDTHQEEHLGDLYTESGQTLQGSLSASSKPIFATKYSFESSRRDLHNTLLCTALESDVEKSVGKRILTPKTPNPKPTRKVENKKRVSRNSQ